ncbi:hypothetical protein UY3_17860 [Chelonia mydas]|uniref:Uncharacterized protein n=1 Tax=Chelonia mydas TaxID=8469 RepID=M7AKV0_CHEMY|nr:hypothetical protein UY3_17860 [Chelonia mydas]
MPGTRTESKELVSPVLCHAHTPSLPAPGRSSVTRIQGDKSQTLRLGEGRKEERRKGKDWDKEPDTPCNDVTLINNEHILRCANDIYMHKSARGCGSTPSSSTYGKHNLKGEENPLAPPTWLGRKGSGPDQGEPECLLDAKGLDWALKDCRY